MKKKSKRIRGGNSRGAGFVGNYLNEIKWYSVFAFSVFAIAFIVGFSYPVFFREEIRAFIEEMLKSLQGMSFFETALFIFYNNLRSAVFSIIFGLILGIYPIATALFNGYLLGFISRGAANSNGIHILWRIFPHGVFELPAVIFSIGIGIKIGFDFLRPDSKPLRENFKDALKFFIIVILPLLLIAAIIETILVTYIK